MTQVADWQMAHPSGHGSTDWTYAMYQAGLTAWAQMAEDECYIEAVQAWGKKNNWQLGERLYYAHDHCVGQVYLALHEQQRDAQMIHALSERLDWILAQDKVQSRQHWHCCDALFMAAPVWARLARLTGQSQYLDFMNEQWWRTTDHLYDRAERLFLRDDRFLAHRDNKGNKIFWCQGNAWVLAALTQILECMPTEFGDRPRYLRLYRDMAARLVELQGRDGLWRTSLLNPVIHPLPEAGGSGLICYALACGVNRGFLREKTYLPAVKKAWQGLVSCVHPDGKLGSVQPMGEGPGPFHSDLTEIYGVGAFLLAGTEVYKIAVRQDNPVTLIHAANPVNLFRDNETLELPLRELRNWRRRLLGNNMIVFDLQTNRLLVTQSEDKKVNGQYDKLLFQSDFSPNQQRWFWIMTPSRTMPAPQAQTVTFGRFVPERKDDFAWENDRMAFRMYGAALEDESISSGVDVWAKRVAYPVIDKWYAEGDYHADQGEGLDFYKVGPHRGCGGLGILRGHTLYTSRNFRKSRVLANGPIRTVFELSYAPWDVNGVQVSEIKRVSLDLGSYLNRFESRFQALPNQRLRAAVGITLAGPQQGHYKQGLGLTGYWPPAHAQYGTIGCGVVFPDAFEAQHAKNDVHLFLIDQVEASQPLVYYAGACWDQPGPFHSLDAWMDYLEAFGTRLKHPINIQILH